MGSMGRRNSALAPTCGVSRAPADGRIVSITVCLSPETLVYSTAAIVPTGALGGGSRSRFLTGVDPGTLGRPGSTLPVARVPSRGAFTWLTFRGRFRGCVHGFQRRRQRRDWTE